MTAPSSISACYWLPLFLAVARISRSTVVEMGLRVALRAPLCRVTDFQHKPSYPRVSALTGCRRSLGVKQLVPHFLENVLCFGDFVQELIG
jgi:hypothetical protein